MDTALKKYQSIAKRYVFWGLLICFTTTFVITPFFDRTAQPLNLFFIITAAFALIAVVTGRRSLMLGLVLGLAATIGITAQSIINSDATLLMFYVTVSAFFLFTSAALTRQIFITRRVTTNTLLASICVYFAIAIVWGMLYGLIEFAIPDSFVFSKNSGAASHINDYMYFSVVTLTTLGYGDISPISTVAQPIAAMEALVGQLYLTVLVARLVGLHIAERQSQEPLGVPEV